MHWVRPNQTDEDRIVIAHPSFQHLVAGTFEVAVRLVSD
jgi:hypothetical protein